jgi:hypothetical protein
MQKRGDRRLRRKDVIAAVPFSLIAIRHNICMMHRTQSNTSDFKAVSWHDVPVHGQDRGE